MAVLVRLFASIRTQMIPRTHESIKPWEGGRVHNLGKGEMVGDRQVPGLGGQAVYCSWCSPGH